ncbi:sensor histidine kinase [Paenibacillus glycinis]|uniref:HAMP domain-containing protein n=1 Tax=Paenibacillus glycinis TaxID=2697035 RepID=A0ABW9XWL1_9BACL|nr:histidine kinase [Paenibacillus glycinis]NBD27019.1 HAMP domain-containing protein [Paenibacillus glycinis]
MVNWWSISIKTKIQNQFFFYYLFLAVIPLLALSYYSYHTIKTDAQKELVNTISFDMRQSQSSLDDLYRRFQKYMDILSNSTTFYSFVLSAQNDIKQGKFQHAKYIGTMSLDPQIKSLFATDDIISAAMVVIDGRVVYSYKSFVSVTNDFKNNPVITSTQASPTLRWFSNQFTPFGVFEGKYSIITKNIFNIMGNNPSESLCQIILLVKQKTMNDLVNDQLRFPDSIVRVMDTDNTIIAGNDHTFSISDQRIASMTQKLPINQNTDNISYIDNFFALKNISNVTNWRIVQLSPSKHVTQSSSAIILFSTILVFVLLLLMFLFSFFISKEILLPVKRLANAMKKVGEMNIKMTVVPNSKNELSEIANGFNQMVERIDNLFRHTIEIERQKRKSEIDMLKYQINPHFLYNTINSIRFSAMKHQDETTANMLVTLSRLLRNTLSHPNNVIALREEMLNIQDYIRLQQLRYDNQLNVEYQIEEHTSHLLVPHMILQPIVENAILHGLNQNLNTGVKSSIILSSVLMNKTTLILSVHDNGIGITSSILEKLLDHESSFASDSLRIGFVNIHKRIRLQYGEPYGIEIESEAGSFTDVKIILPVLNDVENTDTHFISEGGTNGK